MRFIINKQRKLFQAKAWVRLLVDSKPDDWLRNGALDDMHDREWEHYFHVVNHPAVAYVLVKKMVEDHIVHRREVPTTRIKSVIDTLPIYSNWREEIHRLLRSVELGHYDPVH